MSDDGIKLAGAYVELNTKDNTPEQVAETRKRIEAEKPVTIPVQLGPVDAVEAREKAQAEVDADPVKIPVKVDEKSARDAGDNLGRQVSSSAGKAASEGSGGIGALLTAGIVAAAPVAGAAILAGVGAGFVGATVLAEKNNQQVQASYKELGDTVKTTMAQAFAADAPEIASFGAKATSLVHQLAPELASAAGSLKPMISEMGDGLLSAAQKGIGGAAQEVTKLKPIADAITGDFDKVETGVAGMFAHLDVAKGAQVFSSIGTAVEDVLPAIGELASDIAPLVSSVLPAAASVIRNVVTPAGHQLANMFTDVAATVTFLSPVLNVLGTGLGAIAPEAVAVLGVTRLLGSGWLDLGGAAQKLSSIGSGVTNMLSGNSGAGAKLAQVFGITTAEVNKQTIADAELAVTKAKLKAMTDEATAAELEAYGAAEGSTKAQLELAAAQGAAAESADAAAVAESELAAASDAAEISMGPIGIVLGVVGAAALAMGMSSGKAADQTQDLSQQMIQLGQAGPTAAAGLAANSADLQKFSGELKTIGSNAQEFSTAFSGSAATAQAYVDKINAGTDAAGKYNVKISETIKHNNDGTNSLQKYYETAKQASDATDGNTDAYNRLSPELQKAVDNYRAHKDVLAQAKKAQDDEKASTDAQTAALAAQGIVLTAGQQGWNTYGNSVGASVSAYQDVTSGAKAFFDNTLAADSTFYSAQSNFQQLDQAVTQAGQSYKQAGESVASASNGVKQAAQGLASARHSEEQSADAVVTAEKGVATAIRGVGTASQQLVQAQNAEKTSRQQLTAADAAAAQQLADLKRQVEDQATSEESAQLQLAQAQEAVNAAGLQHTKLKVSDLDKAGSVTSANVASYQLLLQLKQAQDALNDSKAQSATLDAQNKDAQAAGIKGNSQVVSAQNQVTQSQQAAAQAAQGLQTAKDGVTSASKAVAAAQYAEQQAHQATENASYAEGQASAQLRAAISAQSEAAHQLTVAKDNDTRSTSLNTVQGLQNTQTVEGLWEANFKATGNIAQATAATEAQGTQLGFTKTQIDHVINSLTGLDHSTATFGVVGQPSVDLSQLINAATRQGLDPIAMGFSSSQVGNARASGSGIFPTHADGGLIAGPGGPRDDVIPSLLSNGEFVVNADSTAKNLALLHAMNDGKVAHFANGGQVGAGQRAIVSANLLLAEVGSVFQSARGAYNLSGITKELPGLPRNNPPEAVSSGGPSSIKGAQIPTGMHAVIIEAAMAAAGVSGADWLAGMNVLIGRESSWNPNSINLTDSNARAGHPSQGLAQTIPGTFEAYRVKSLPNNILDPVANVAAAIRYILHTYGSIEHVQQANPNLPPKGYYKGGPVSGVGSGTSDSNLIAASDGEFVMNASATKKNRPALDAMNAGKTVGGVTYAPVFYISQQPREDGSVLAGRIAAETAWALQTQVGG